MRTVISSRKWLIHFSVIVLALLLLMSAVVFIVDPYFQFRVRDDTYLLNAKYVNGGLIKNHEYDTLLLGSSMTQNFDMSLFKQEMGGEPLRISMSGMSMEELSELMELASSVGKADTYYICIDIWSLANDTRSSDNVPYLLSEAPGATVRYALSHEAWFYSIPVCSAQLVLKKLGIQLPESIANLTSIDRVGNWEDLYTYDEDTVLQNYLAGIYNISDVDTDRMCDIAKKQIDSFFSFADQLDEELNFFFPPYSGLFWYSKQSSMDKMTAIKRYFVEQASMRGYDVFDFQSQPFITDLNNYRDTTHYRGEINDWMVGRFSKTEDIVTPENFDRFHMELQKYIEITAEKYNLPPE